MCLWNVFRTDSGTWGAVFKAIEKLSFYTKIDGCMYERNTHSK